MILSFRKLSNTFLFLSQIYTIGMLSFGRIADLLGGHIAGLLTAIFSFIGVAMMM